MTDSVKEISGTQGTSVGGSYSGGSCSEHHKKKGAAGQQNDLIEISREAQDRSKGKTKMSIMEYLKEMPG